MEEQKQREKKIAAMARIEEKKLEMMSQKARMHFQKKKSKEAANRPLCLVRPFVADSVHSRLNLLEIMTLMSDYRSAYHMVH